MDCIVHYICPDQGRTLAVTPRTSGQQYMQKTRGLSMFPRSVFAVIKDSLILPCRLVEPSLCGNAEIAGFLAKVPMWSTHNPEERVLQCEKFIKLQCPRLLGNGYSRFQVKVDGSCGERSFNAQAVPVPPPQPSLVSPATVCTDDDLLGQTTVTDLVRANPMMNFVLMGVEKLQGLPPGAILMSLTCATGHQLAFCRETAGVTHPYRSGEIVETLALFGAACPATCCAGGESGCPTPCAAAGRAQGSNASAAVFGTLTCVGHSCGGISMAADASSGVVTISARGWGYRDAAKIIVRTSVELRVQVSALEIGRADDAACTNGYLEIDGKRCCRGNQPSVVSIPHRVGDVVELKWFSEDSCSDCQWEIMIMDAGEPSSFAVSEMEFEGVKEFSDILHVAYRVFFVLILYLWTGYILVEVGKVLLFLFFLGRCPSFPGSRSSRVCLILGAGLPRLLLAVWVYGVGCVLLIAAPDYVDVVLNSVALAFILDLDEIIFELAVPSHVKEKIAQTESFHWSAWHCRSLFVEMQAKMLVPVVSALLICLIQYSWPRGFRVLSEQMHCACHLQGSHCFDAVF
mmetsp:Transcript_93688/g.293045  ORF Transcript_93688/g.293045 Transcript_93688/m.293045 type:complete len:573 (-) Transcript_93688:223-1941(-)